MKCYSFLGIQGSGKGTQSELLSKYLKYQHINTGDLFRAHINKQTTLGIEVKSIINKGGLVPDDLVFQLIEKSINNNVQGIVFDGFPRTVHQAEFLVKEYELQKVFYLDLTEKEAMKRIQSRRICSLCGKNYNVIFQPPLNEGKCNTCGGDLIIRMDDQAEAIKLRFTEYFRQTQPLINFFEPLHKLIIVKADKPIDIIFEEIKTYL